MPARDRAGEAALRPQVARSKLRRVIARLHLERLLSCYAPDDGAQRGFLEAMVRLAASSSDPTARAHYEPGHFTASAFVLSPERDRLLLIEHAKLGRWLQPGGHLEPTDVDLIQAARRELVEETGLSEVELALPGIFDLDVHGIPARGIEPAHLHFDVRFLFRAPTLAVAASSEVKAALWVALDQAAAPSADASVRRAARRLIGSASAAQLAARRGVGG